MNIKITLSGDAAETIWTLINNCMVGKLHPDQGVPYAVYELRCTLNKLRELPDDEMRFNSPERVKHCHESNLTGDYFPSELEWEFPQYLLVILKLVLIYSMQLQTGSGVEGLLELSKMFRIEKWFLKTFKRPFSVQLDDDCKMDDEIEAEINDALDESHRG